MYAPKETELNSGPILSNRWKIESAAEQPKTAYVLAFGHSALLDYERAHTLVGMALQLYQARNPQGRVCVAVVNHKLSALGGDWDADVEFSDVGTPRWQRERS